MHVITATAACTFMFLTFATVCRVYSVFTSNKGLLNLINQTFEIEVGKISVI